MFTFVDASQMISKAALWEERDRAISAGIKKLNNEVVDKFAADKQARFGCKGKNKHWFGYKRHVAACMKHGLTITMQLICISTLGYRPPRIFEQHILSNNMQVKPSIKYDC